MRDSGLPDSCWLRGAEIERQKRQWARLVLRDVRVECDPTHTSLTGSTEAS